VNAPDPLPSAAPHVDIHVHLAGVGTQGSGCWMSPRFRRRLTFLGLRLLYRIGPRQMRDTVDADWATLVSEEVRGSELDLAVVLGFDGAYDARGNLDLDRSQMIVPPEWVFEVCERHPNLAPGPSINPLRSDAIEQLETAIQRRAALIKWLPSAQGFDPADPSLLPFYERLAASGIPLLVHSGSGEVTFRTLDRRAADLERLLPALDTGVTIICAHSAARVRFSRDPDQQPLLRRLLDRFPNLWVDNSGLANPSRSVHLPRLARDQQIRDRTLHGSDFPVISNAFYYLRKLPLRDVSALESIRNRLQRDISIKRRLGYPESTFTRAASVLPNLTFWHRPGPGSG
jgi:uncharacterized protein